MRRVSRDRVRRVHIAFLVLCSVAFYYMDQVSAQSPQPYDLRVATEQGNMAKTEALIKAGLNVNTEFSMGESPLILAAKNGHIDVVKLLLDNGADVNMITGTEAGGTALMAACRHGQSAAAIVLIERGADINIKNKLGSTALIAAMSSGMFDVVKTLVERKADVSVSARDGRTPLMMAAWVGHKKIVAMLLSSGADPNARDMNKNTALHGACLKGWAEVVGLLIEARADVNPIGQYGVTPLMAACLNGHLPIVKLLLEKKVDLNAQTTVPTTVQSRQPGDDRQGFGPPSISHGQVWTPGLGWSTVNVQQFPAGMTALAWAKARGHRQVEDLLRSHGAED